MLSINYHFFSFWNSYISWYFGRILPGCWLPARYCGMQCSGCWHVWLCLSYPNCSVWHSSCTWGEGPCLIDVWFTCMIFVYHELDYSLITLSSQYCTFCNFENFCLLLSHITVYRFDASSFSHQSLFGRLSLHAIVYLCGVHVWRKLSYTDAYHSQHCTCTCTVNDQVNIKRKLILRDVLLYSHMTFEVTWPKHDYIRSKSTIMGEECYVVATLLLITPRG